MKILIAPLHYIVDKSEGSEYGKAYDYLEELARKHTNISGTVLVAYSPVKQLGKFKVISMLKKKPNYISNIFRIKFVIWVYYYSRKLIRENDYKAIWHNGPFSIDETFSLLALFRPKKIKFIVGPIPSPHIFMGKDENRSMGKKIEISDTNFIRLILNFDQFTYPLAKLFKSLSLMSLKASSTVIVLDTTAKKMLEDRGIKNVLLCSTGVNTSRFLQNNTKKTTHKRSSINLINVSYLVVRKNTSALIQAMHKVVFEYGNKDVFLTIVGDGPDIKNIHDQIKKYSLENNVTLIGFIPLEQIQEYYLNADAFITASFSESMAAMYFEAMAASLPIISSKNQASLDLFTGGLKGKLVFENKSEYFAKAITSFYTNKKNLANLGEQNKKLLIQNYNFSQQINKLVGTF